jgi:hypothetical protein
MSNGKSTWLKSLLIKEDGEKSTQNQKTANTTQFPKFNPGMAHQPVTPPLVVDTETPDQAYLDHLYRFMEDQNIPGPDYFEYANTLHEMSQMAGAIPEQNLYQLAYVGLKAQGVTPTALVQTATKYIELFGKHKKEFENYLTQEGSAQVTAKMQENQAIEQRNTAAEVKINELTQQIQALQQQMVSDTQRVIENNTFVQNENQKITIKKIKFEKAYKIVVDKVSGDIQKIQNYIK